MVLDATAATAAEFIYSRIIARYGCVESIQSDNGPHFINQIIQYLTQTLNIRHRVSTPYYPQSNGKVERVIGTLKNMLQRTVAAAAEAQAGANANSDGDKRDGDIKVFGVGLALDTAILDAIAVASDNSAKSGSPANVEQMDDVPTLDGSVSWAPLLHTVLWVYWASPHSATGLSPALLAFGREL